ncbi:GGDEF domain-containing protein [Marinimicrococcus flavescens]|uniref:GGDEF domain-containing protein n=1 Tax=Marinimicrococcus flavescens TaxID=3031815 RepID=A0AAP4D6W3_9PROT|nr:GGDEF domain-containing protein [Marinimicrococcus flavescens]
MLMRLTSAARGGTGARGRAARLSVLTALVSLGLGIVAGILLLAERRQHGALETVVGQLVNAAVENHEHRLARQAMVLAGRPGEAVPAIEALAADQGGAAEGSVEGLLLSLDGRVLRAFPEGAVQAWRSAARPWPGLATLLDHAAGGDGATSGVIGGPDGPALAAAARLDQEVPGENGEAASLLMLVVPLGPPLLDRLAAQQGLVELRLEEVPPAPAKDGQKLMLTTRDGVAVGRLAWTSGLADGTLLDWVLPLLVGDVVLLLVLCGAVLHGQREASSRVRAAERQAQLDVLTGLGNRAFLQEHLAARLDAAGSSGEELALLYVDLDGFKTVNDTHGHAAGDRLLTAVGRRLRRALREDDAIARVGGDEFIVVQAAAGQPGAALLLCRRLLAQLSQPFGRGTEPLRISASIGVAVARQGEAPAALIERADQALYRAKAAGPVAYCLTGGEPVRFRRPAEEPYGRISRAVG